MRYTAPCRFASGKCLTVWKLMTTPKDSTSKKLIIYGVTYGDQRFRPSDWGERLAGDMSQFRPEGSAGGPLTYSPCVVPRIIDGVRCVVADSRISGRERLGWRYACNLGRDNNKRSGDMGFNCTSESK